jgi:serine phosphatase RsbU (regulator of sigma subunit)
LFRSADAPDAPVFDPRLPPAPFRRPPRMRGVPTWRGHDVGWLIPLLVFAATIVFELVTEPEPRLLYWLVLVPWLSVGLCGLRTTVVFTAVSVLCATILYVISSKPYSNVPPVYVLLAVNGVLAVVISWLLIRREESLVRIRDVAETTRRVVLRPLPPGLGGLDHGAVYLPAVDEAQIGGDFYDIQPSRWGTRVLIGDVQGKGLDAVEIAAALLGTFREAGYHEESLETVAEHLEIRLRRQIAARLDLGVEDDRDRFATAVILGFPADEPQALEMVNFGHEAPLLVHADGTVLPLPEEHGLPLGMSEIAEWPPPLVRTRIEPGTTVLLTTDGVTEVRGAGDLYPLRAEVEKAVADPAVREPGALAATVHAGVLRHGQGRLTDDTTILAVRRRTGRTGEATSYEAQDIVGLRDLRGGRERPFRRLPGPG